MSRWNIGKILLYSNDNRVREINLDLQAVNIITGKSHTGKSSITEIIDYVMGSRDCNIASFVRSSCSWVGILWIKEPSKLLLCRRVPALSELTTNDYYTEVGNTITPPSSASSLYKMFDRESAIRKFEQMLGLGEVTTENLNSPDKPRKRISLRSVMPFLLLDDDVIINKLVSIRGAGDERKQLIIDTMAYFLGVVSEQTYAKEARLKLLRQRQERSQRAQTRQSVRRELPVSRLIALLDEASEAGIDISNQPALSSDIFTDSNQHIVNIYLERLRLISLWTEEIATNDTSSILDNLYKDEQSILEQINSIRSKIRSGSRLINAASSYDESINIQRRRLESIDFIPSNFSDSCPVCNQQIVQASDIVESIRVNISQIDIELRQVERERPQIDQYLQDLEQQRGQLTLTLREIRSSIGEVIRSSESNTATSNLRQRRDRVIGRITMFLDTLNDIESGTQSKVEDDSLAEEIAKLEEELDVSSKIQTIESIRVLISGIMSEIIDQLPFEPRYRQYNPDFNPRDLTLGVITPLRRELMREIGSDENYLTLHIALSAALHRHFFAINAPVPGFILIDQISRPYFPEDSSEPLNEVDFTTRSESETLRQYFDFLFKETARGQSLQVLILEHAYFPNDQNYVSATKERWINENGLVPNDWPERSLQFGSS